MATTTRPLTLLRGRGLVLKQLAQSCCSGVVECRSQSAFHGFQVGSAAFVALREDAAQELFHFPRNFLMVCSSRFFSWSVQPPLCGCTGRSSQIFSLTRNNSSLSFCRR